MPVVTSLNFFGRTEEALAFYHEALGAETIFMMRFRDCPDQSFAQTGMEEKVFHATFRIEGTELTASDVGYVNDQSGCEFTGFALAIRLNSVDRAKQVFNALAENGQILIPLAESSFTTLYGIVVDRFGISWKINVDQEAENSLPAPR